MNPVTRDAPAPMADTKGRLAGTAYPAFSSPALTPAWVSSEQSALLDLIDAAHHSLRIQVMTLSAIDEYIPAGYWPALDSALRNAAAHGVSVHIIVADWALREPMQSYLKSLTVLPHVTVKYSKLPPAPRGVIPYARLERCKYAVADDDLAYVGAGNRTRSYFTASIDAGVFLDDAAAARTLEQIFARDWSGPYVHSIDPDHRYRPPRTH